MTFPDTLATTGRCRIIGIDPGSQRTGIGIIEVDETGRSHHVFHTALVLLGNATFPLRLKQIFDEIGDLIEAHGPTEAAIERVFMARNPDSALKLGQARGAAICAVASRELPIAEYAATEVKQAVVGGGGADKSQVQHMVGILLGLSGRLQADAADALAVALAHAHTRASVQRIGIPPYRLEAPPMIGRLRGTLISKQPPWLLIDVNGVGYELEAPMSTFFDLPAVGSEVVLRTHYAVKEDAVALYGFLSENERALFRSIQKVSGIGAKTALAVLSGVPVDAFARLVQSGDVAALTRIPGIGKKTAERIVVELRDRVDGLGSGGPGGTAIAAATDPVGEASTALIALGYKPAEVSRLIKDASAPGDAAEDIIRKALKAALR